jgi:hypothetical protein
LRFDGFFFSRSSKRSSSSGPAIVV